jgi:hypothetical protein
MSTNERLEYACSCTFGMPCSYDCQCAYPDRTGKCLRHVSAEASGFRQWLRIPNPTKHWIYAFLVAAFLLMTFGNSPVLDRAIHSALVVGNDENDQWKGETLALCQGKNRVASDGVSDRISFCQKVPMSVASQKGQ